MRALPILLLWLVACGDPDAGPTDHGGTADSDVTTDTDPVADTDADPGADSDVAPDTDLADTDGPTDTSALVDTDRPVWDTSPPDETATPAPSDTDVADTDTAVDTAACPGPWPEPCAPGETLTCTGACVPDFLALPGDPRRDCIVFGAPAFGPGPAATPGYHGAPSTRGVADPSTIPLLRTCWGEARASRPEYGDGRCDEEWNCDLLQWDGGDCFVHTSYAGHSVVVRSAADVTGLRNTTELDVLEVDGATLTSASFPNLKRLHHLVVHGDALTVVSLPELRGVDGRIQMVDAASLTTFSAPQLATVGGDWRARKLKQREAMHIDDLPSLTTLELPALAHVGAGLRLSRLPRISDLRLPSLVQVMGTLKLDTLVGVTELHLDALQQVGNHLLIEGVRVPSVVSLRALESVGGKLAVGSAWYAPTYPQVVVPKLRRAGELIFSSRGHLDLSALETVAGRMWVSAGSLSAGRLRSVGAGFVVSWVDGALDLCALEEVGELNLSTSTSSRFGVSLDPTASHDVHLPLLTDAGDRVSISVASNNSVPVSVDLSALLSASKVWIGVSGAAPVPRDVNLGALRSVTGEGRISATTTDLHALTSAGHLTIYVDDLTLPALTHVDFLDGRVSGVVSVPSLTSVVGVDLWTNNLSMPSLVDAGSLRLTAGQFDLSSLATAGPLTLNPMGDLTLPSLTRADRLALTTSERFTAPLLQRADSVSLIGGGLFSLGSLSVVQELSLDPDTSSNPVYSLPALSRVGTLDLYAAPGASIDLPDLQTVDSNIRVSGGGASAARLNLSGLKSLHDAIFPAVPALDLSSLQSATKLQIGQSFALCEGALPGVRPAWSTPMTLRLDSLASVDHLDIMHTEGLTELSLPRLRTVTGRMRVVDLPYATSASLPALVRVTTPVWINFRNLPRLTSIDLHSAVEVGRLAFWDTGLTVIDLPGIVTFHDRISVRHNPGLTTLRYDGVTTAGGIDVGENPLLSTFELPQLTSVTDDVTIDFNTSLPTCEINAILAGVSVGGTVDVHANEACVP